MADGKAEILAFCEQHGACKEGREWALAECGSMAEVWEKAPAGYLIWVATCDGVLDECTQRLLACQFVRYTPLGDGRTVWDLLTDPRSKAVVETAERYAKGEATREQLKAALDAAWDAAWEEERKSARDAAWATGWDVAQDAARASARDAARGAASDVVLDAAREAARDWQAAHIRATIANPFKKGGA